MPAAKRTRAAGASRQGPRSASEPSGAPRQRARAASEPSGASRPGARAAAKPSGASRPSARAAANPSGASRAGARAAARPSGASRPGARAASAARRRPPAPVSVQGVASLAEQLVHGAIRPRELVMLTRERIQQTLDDAAARGRLTRRDANELVAELVRLGRSHGDGLLAEVEALLERGRQELGAVSRRARGGDPVVRIVRSAAQRARGGAPPIEGYDRLRAAEVPAALRGLSRPKLRAVLDYERRHANRKSVVAAIERALR